MSSDRVLPALRPVDIAPFQTEQGELHFSLHDNSQIAPRALAVSVAGYFVLAHLDGTHTREQVQLAFGEQFGQNISGEQIDQLVHVLDDSLLLQNERYEAAYLAKAQAYRAAAVRDNRSRWPSAETLREALKPVLNAETEPAGSPRGIVAPHLDYARGEPCYAAGYAALKAAQPADRYVVLGTNHFGRSTSVVATGKDFLTPFGAVTTDRGFIDRLEQRLGLSLRERELDHLAEHSIELQVHLLQLVQQTHPFEIVPVLCPDPSGPSGTRPSDGRGADLGDFADALAGLLREDPRPTIVIASADLSHVGQRFGDPEPTTPQFLEDVAAHDLALLALLEQGAREAFVAGVAAVENRTRICSVGCIYAAARALPDARFRVARYHQAVDMAAETHVSCAAAVLGD